jgi:hypothetical protein
MISLAAALSSLTPGAAWSMVEDDYENIAWYSDDYPKPTLAEIQAEQIRLQAVEDANAYKALRAAEYPSFADQFDLLYHGGYDAWRAAVQAVKDKYPKE